jgi:hypothetical protein
MKGITVERVCQEVDKLVEQNRKKALLETFEASPKHVLFVGTFYVENLIGVEKELATLAITFGKKWTGDLKYLAPRVPVKHLLPEEMARLRFGLLPESRIFLLDSKAFLSSLNMEDAMEEILNLVRSTDILVVDEAHAVAKHSIFRDGVKAKGIRALFNALHSLHQVTIVAPAKECNASSHSITLKRPLKIKK